MRSLVLAVTLLTLASCSSPVVHVPMNDRVRSTPSGETAPIDFYAAVNPDCSLLGYFTVRVISPPVHGELTSDHGEAYAYFPNDKVRAACEKVKVPVTFIRYRSNPGFTGTDSTEIEIVGPLGKVFGYRYAIEVR